VVFVQMDNGLRGSSRSKWCPGLLLVMTVLTELEDLAILSIRQLALQL